MKSMRRVIGCGCIRRNEVLAYGHHLRTATNRDDFQEELLARGDLVIFYW